MSELIAAQEQILLLGSKTATERLATFLQRLSEANDERGEDPLGLRLPTSRSDISDYLGLTIETVSRTFTRLQRLGVLDLRQPKTVIIRDIDRLSELAEAEQDPMAY